MYNNRGVILERRELPMGNYKDGIWLKVRDLASGAYVTMWGDPLARTELAFTEKDQRIGYTLNGNNITAFCIYWLESPGTGEVVDTLPNDGHMQPPAFPPGMYNNRATILKTRVMMMGSGKDAVWLLMKDFETGGLVSVYGDPMVMTDLAFADRSQRVGYTANGVALTKFGISWFESPRPWESEPAPAATGK